MVKFSIVIPTYNCKEYIKECINSILNQTYTNYEIIVVDDGSTDNTKEGIKKYIESGEIKYFYQDNSGAPVARNRGIEMSNGEYLILLDSDDKLTENILSIINDKLENNVDLLIGNYKIIDKNSNLIETCTEYNKEEFIQNEDVFKLCVKNPCPSNKVYKSKIIKENNLKFDNVAIGQDLNFFIKYLIYAKNVKSIKECMYFYRMVEGSISRTYTFKILKIIETFEYIKDFYLKNNKEREYNEYVIYAEIIHYYTQFCKIVFFNKKEDRAHIANEFEKHAKKLLKIKKKDKCFDNNTQQTLRKFYWKLKFRQIFISNTGRKIYLKLQRNSIRRKLKELIKKNIIKFIYYFFPKRKAHEILYYIMTRKKIDLKNPKNFDEKIHWLIVNEYGEKYSKYADKIEVRKYIEEKGYGNILTKLYGIYNNANEIDLNELPNKFVLKANHNSGNVFICSNKNNFDIENCKKVLNKELKKNYACELLEYHYKYIKPKIMCEEYLEEENMIAPLDYKIHCFNGKAECIMLCSERDTEVKYDFYDLNWNYLDYSEEQFKSSKTYKKPENLDKMIEIAEDLAKGFKYVRVDLYNIKGKIYFGELTLTHSGGLFYSHVSKEALNYLGEKIEI